RIRATRAVRPLLLELAAAGDHGADRGGEARDRVAAEARRAERRRSARHARIGFAAVAGARGVGGHRGVELGLEGSDALLEVVARVDVLPAAEQRAVRLGALCGAAALKLRGASALTAHLAVDVRLRGALAAALRLALRFAARAWRRARAL